jgi:hypothetical protein
MYPGMSLLKIYLQINSVQPAGQIHGSTCYELFNSEVHKLDLVIDDLDDGSTELKNWKASTNARCTFAWDYQYRLFKLMDG